MSIKKNIGPQRRLSDSSTFFGKNFSTGFSKLHSKSPKKSFCVLEENVNMFTPNWQIAEEKSHPTERMVFRSNHIALEDNENPRGEG